VVADGTNAETSSRLLATARNRLRPALDAYVQSDKSASNADPVTLFMFQLVADALLGAAGSSTVEPSRLADVFNQLAEVVDPTGRV
jgi:hypothetical protein